MGRGRRGLMGGVLGAGLWLGMLPAAQAQAATAVAQLDLSKFLGQWYEVARLPSKTDKKCVGGAFSLYAAGEKARHYSEVSSCLDAKKVTQIQNVDGTQDKNGSGKLRVRYFVLLHHTYLVLAVAPEGAEPAWAVMGTPNHKQLYILSRTAVLPPESLAEARAKAAASGYDASKLEAVPQAVSGRKSQVVSGS